ncbi:MAG TPA: hypothetical protein VFB29_00385 [Pseudolabrys sp.]|nr:hypothetical protein [Pseudolabrys sp.]
MTENPSTESFRIRNERKAAQYAAQILGMAAIRGVTPADLFLSLAAVAGNKNPYFARKLLEALEATVRARPVQAVKVEPATETGEALLANAGEVFAAQPVSDECGCPSCTSDNAALPAVDFVSERT